MYLPKIIWYCVCIIYGSVNAMDLYKFPPGFKFGIATSAYQIEGAWNVSDKSMNIWDVQTHKPNMIFDGSTGDVAADSYHLYKRDVEMLKELNVNFYRFSVSWTRILPNGFANKISVDGKSYYNDLINELLKNDIEPMLTIYHWDLPQVLQDYGGWLNPLIVDWFEDYARVLFDLFGDRVKKWITINEPCHVCYMTYGVFQPVGFAPNLNLTGTAEYLCAKNIIMAHARVYHLFDKQYRQKNGGIIGISNNINYYETEGNSVEEQLALESAYEFTSYLFVDPIFSKSGGLSSFIKDRIAKQSALQGYPRSRLPDYTNEEINHIKGTSDFFGLNFYGSKLVVPIKKEVFSDTFEDDAGVSFTGKSKWKSTESSWFFFNPEDFRKIINIINNKYNQPHIIITENGFSSNKGLYDVERIDYHKKYLEQMLLAIYIDRVNITHYTAWSLMDNFEWIAGYTGKYGFYHIDYENGRTERRPKWSAYFYQHTSKTKILDMNFNISLDM